MTHPIRSLKAKYAAERAAVTYQVTVFDPKTHTTSHYTIGSAK